MQVKEGAGDPQYAGWRKAGNFRLAAHCATPMVQSPAMPLSIPRRIGLWLAAALAVAQPGCDALSPSLRYDCQLQGETFRYRGGTRIGPAGVQPLRVPLVLRGEGFEVPGVADLPEMASPGAGRDAARSSPVEVVYLRDTTDAATRQRTVSSLVLNLTSGDARLFHHRWEPPAGWKDSDQYLFTGRCVRATR